MGATCSHTLMRAAEVLDLMDCGEAIMNAALARQETRANHVRSDFPFTNPLLADKFLTVGLEGDEVVARWRPIRQPVSRKLRKSGERPGGVPRTAKASPAPSLSALPQSYPWSRHVRPSHSRTL